LDICEQSTTDSAEKWRKLKAQGQQLLWSQGYGAKKLVGYRGHSANPKLTSKKAKSRAEDLVPVISEMQAAGKTSLTAIAEA